MKKRFLKKDRTFSVVGFTLIELIVVIVIIGILTSFAFPKYTRIKQNALDREAKANLQLIQAAEKIYHMEEGSYCSAATTALINTNLKLSLPTSEKYWKYSVNSAATATAVRSSTKNSGTKDWTLAINQEDPS